MRYKIHAEVFMGQTHLNVLIDRGDEQFTSFPAEPGNPVYDSFLESQSLTDDEVQAMEPDVWHDLA